MTTDIEYVELLGKLKAAEARLDAIADEALRFAPKIVRPAEIQRILDLATDNETPTPDEAARVAAAESVCDQTPQPGIPKPGSKPPF